MIKKIFNKLFHPPEYPAELPSQSGKVSYWYQWHMRLMDMGRGQVFGKVTQLFQESALLLLVIDKLGYANLTVPTIAIFALFGSILVWFSGWCYVMLKQDIVQAVLGRHRDVMFKDIYDLIKGERK